MAQTQQATNEKTGVYTVHPPFPCGCRGIMEHRQVKDVLVIVVSPSCKFDCDKAGRDTGSVRYVGEYDIPAGATIKHEAY